jgi:alkylation response protein AidB-like acyl-CoA dehydrogenase
MHNYTPPLRDYAFILHEVLKIDQQTEVEGYDELTPDFTGAIFEEAGKIASEVLAPINAKGDAGCTFENGVVRAPEGFRAAVDLFRKGGWPSLECDPAYGGQGMPTVIGLPVGEMQSSANMSLMMYPGLTHGAYSAIHKHGSDALKDLYLPKLTSGEWMGTMNLTEPHCGTDLALLRTKADPNDDGSYTVTGQKIFISSGEHDLAENIVHLVLARIPGAPEGVKGISLFAVPKIIPNADGSLGERNALSCGKIEHKMGIHGNSTCVMDYDGATGWLVGEAHEGLKAMFTMMNEARLLVGMQGLSQAEAAYQAAAAYARERLQGRAVTGDENPDGPADPIIVHPDVRRMLMDQKAFVEGARAFMLWGCSILDAGNRHSDEAKRKEASLLTALLIPVLKAFLTDKGFESAVQAQQVFGGHGYIEETGVAQYVRDARIAMIYEGANGVQALDLVGRKLPMKGGAPIMGFFEIVKSFIKENEGDADLKAGFLDPLKAASKDLQAAGMYFMQEGVKNPNAALAGSVDFLHLFGHVCLGLCWAMMAKEARAALAAGAEDAAFYETKLATGRYYMARLLPETALRLARIQTGAEPVMALDAEAF